MVPYDGLLIVIPIGFCRISDIGYEVAFHGPSWNALIISIQESIAAGSELAQP